MKTSETNGVTGITIVRELTIVEEQELQQSRVTLNESAERSTASLAAKEAARASALAKLAALGLSDDEIAALVGG